MASQVQSIILAGQTQRSKWLQAEPLLRLSLPVYLEMAKPSASPGFTSRKLVAIMKKRKIEKQYTYTGFGFPIILNDVPVVEVRGIWTPDVNYNVLQKVVLLELSHMPSSLTGNHIHFIRKYFALTLEEFGKKFGVTHSAVLKWEKQNEKSARILLTTEREIRLFILDTLLKAAKDFRNAYRKLIDQSFILTKSEPLHVNAQCELMVVGL